MTRSQTIAAAVTAVVAIPAALATALFIGGEQVSAPAAIRTPISIGPYTGMTVEGFSWDQAPRATGYRLYLDGIVIGLVPGTRLSTSLAVSCGVRHRFNSQPFNNKGFAPTAPPIYFTPVCDGATR